MTEFGPFRLDLVIQCLWRRGDGADEQRMPLTPKAFAVLRYLVEHAGRLVTQDEMLEALWPETFVQPEVRNWTSPRRFWVDPPVAKLSKKSRSLARRNDA